MREVEERQARCPQEAPERQQDDADHAEQQDMCDDPLEAEIEPDEMHGRSACMSVDMGRYGAQDEAAPTLALCPMILTRQAVQIRRFS